MAMNLPPPSISPPILSIGEVKGKGCARASLNNRSGPGSVKFGAELLGKARNMEKKVRERTGQEQKPWDLDVYEDYKLEIRPPKTANGSDGIYLNISQDAWRIWDGGLQMAKFFINWSGYSEAKELFGGKNCVELGCGGGIAGMALAATGIPGLVTITDMPTVVTEADKNLKLNAKVLKTGSKIKTASLTWGETKIDRKTFPIEEEPDILIGADLVRNQKVGELLLDAVTSIQDYYLINKSKRVSFLYCYGVNRVGLNSFLDQMRKRCTSRFLEKPKGGFDIPHCRIEIFSPKRKQ